MNLSYKYIEEFNSKNEIFTAKARKTFDNNL